MPTELTIVVTDVTRLAVIKKGLALSGRVEQFTNAKLANAFDAIQASQPTVVAVDSVFAQTQQGKGFIERVEKLAIPGSSVRLIVQNGGAWATTAREAPATTAPPPPAKGGAATPAGPVIVAPPLTGTNTRRAARFRLLNAVNASVEGGEANLVNLSVLGAQIVSQPVLRPSQTVKIALPDTQDVLRLTALVAWSMLEQTKDGHAYRAGISFNDAAQQTLEEYCKRHCTGDPLPSF